MSSGNDWGRLAEAATRRRIQLGHKALRGFASHIGVSERTLQAIENAERTGFHPSTKVALEEGLFWAPGSFDRVVHGGEPEALPLPSSERSPLSDMPASELVEQIRERLSELARRVPEEPPRSRDPHPRDDETAMVATDAADDDSATGQLNAPDAQAG